MFSPSCQNSWWPSKHSFSQVPTCSYFRPPWGSPPKFSLFLPLSQSTAQGHWSPHSVDHTLWEKQWKFHSIACPRSWGWRTVGMHQDFQALQSAHISSFASTWVCRGCCQELWRDRPENIGHLPSFYLFWMRCQHCCPTFLAQEMQMWQKQSPGWWQTWCPHSWCAALHTADWSALFCPSGSIHFSHLGTSRGRCWCPSHPPWGYWSAPFPQQGQLICDCCKFCLWHQAPHADLGKQCVH